MIEVPINLRELLDLNEAYHALLELQCMFIETGDSHHSVIAKEAKEKIETIIDRIAGEKQTKGD